MSKSSNLQSRGDKTLNVSGKQHKVKQKKNKK